MAISVNRQSEQALRKRLQAIGKRPENLRCAECKSSISGSNVWCSVNLGICLCTECAAVHRGLGAHISFIRSLSLDKWTLKGVETLDKVGNEKAAAYWEKSIPKTYKRPTSGDYRGIEDFLRLKYIAGLWKSEDPDDKPYNERQTKLQKNSEPQPVFNPFEVTPHQVPKESVDLIEFLPIGKINNQTNESHAKASYPFGFDPIFEVNTGQSEARKEISATRKELLSFLDESFVSKKTNGQRSTPNDCRLIFKF